MLLAQGKTLAQKVCQTVGVIVTLLRREETGRLKSDFALVTSVPIPLPSSPSEEDTLLLYGLTS